MEELFLAAGAVALGVLAWWRVRARGDRQRRLMQLCWRAGLDLAPLDPFPDTTWVAQPRFSHLEQGAENVVFDRDADDGVRVFDHWYEDGAEETGRPARRWETCAVLPVPFSCRRLTVRPRRVDEQMASFADEIRLELEEFDRRFHVTCDDRRFAFALLDQRMMRALLALPAEVSLDADEDTLVLWAPLLPPERVLLLFEAARAVRRHLPRVMEDLYPPRPTRGPHEDRWLQGRWSAEPTGEPVEPGAGG